MPLAKPRSTTTARSTSSISVASDFLSIPGLLDALDRPRAGSAGASRVSGPSGKLPHDLRHGEPAGASAGDCPITPSDDSCRDIPNGDHDCIRCHSVDLPMCARSAPSAK